MLRWQETQPGLSQDGVALFAWLRGPHPLDQEVVLGYDAQGDGGHGRIETRKVWRMEALAGLATLVMGESTRQGAGQDSLERRDDISSLPGTTDADAQRLHGVMRTDWEIENQVHGVLDVARGGISTAREKWLLCVPDRSAAHCGCGPGGTSAG